MPGESTIWGKRDSKTSFLAGNPGSRPATTPDPSRFQTAWAPCMAPMRHGQRRPQLSRKRLPNSLSPDRLGRSRLCRDGVPALSLGHLAGLRGPGRGGVAGPVAGRRRLSRRHSVPVSDRRENRQLNSRSLGRLLSGGASPELYFGRAIMPESWMLAASAAGIYWFLRWSEEDTWGFYLLSAVAVALACLLKLTNLYLGLPLLWLGWRRLRVPGTAAMEDLASRSSGGHTRRPLVLARPHSRGQPMEPASTS